MSRLAHGMVVVLVVVIVVAGVGAVAWKASDPPSSETAKSVEPEVVREEPCPESDFTCVTFRVPRDWFDREDESTIDVTFAILRASGERQGAFVTATGGPGSSGIASADSYTSVFDAAITDAFDVVFFDQRGIGLSEPIQCIDAALDWYDQDAVPTVSDEQAEAYGEAAAQFTSACVRETGVDPAALDSYGTRQAVEDLEVLRRWIGVDRLHLYGESYGTQFVQTYAAAHPDAVAALLVDGPVDLTLSGYDYYVEQARAFDETLVHTLESCTDACADEPFVDGLLGAWDTLAAELERGPLGFQFTRSDGTRETRDLTLGGLELASAGYVYSTTDQMLLQRAVAYAALRGELAPLARLAYVSLGQDPDTFEALPDPTWSDALYFAVECMDYAFGNEDAFLDAGEDAGVDDIRLGSIFYGDLPCASWPVGAASEDRPEYLTTDAYPTLILASTTDPATPYVGARRLFDNVGDGYLVTQPGGPHIIFGRGNACPDDLVTAFLVEGEMPERETECEPMTPDPFIPLPPASASADDDPAAVLLTIDDELYYQPEFWAWDGGEDLAVGCLLGGSVTYTATDVGYDLSLDGCELVDGLPLTGDASYDDVEGTTSMTVMAPGGTDLAYERDAEYAVVVTGTWFGADVGGGG